jgi:hypothetical protein
MNTNFIKSAIIKEFTGTESEYHETKDYTSASKLKKLKVSPLHFKEAEEVEETEAMIFGSAYHCYILEPSRFESEYYVFDDHSIYEVLIGEGYKSPRSTKQYKEWMESEMRLIGNRKSLSITDFEKIKNMKSRLLSHRQVRILLANGINEQGFIAELETTSGNIGVKFKPDKFNENKRFCLDIKTTKDASVDGFTRSAAEMDYHIQAALYSDLLDLRAGNGLGYSFFFIAQEKVAPYAFNLFEASPQFIGQGRYEYELLMQLYKYCIDNNEWPGYQVWCENKYGIVELNLPKYSIKSLDYFIHKL